MELAYSIPIREHYSALEDEYFYDEKEMLFVVDDDLVIDVIADIIIEQTRKSKLGFTEHNLVKNIIVSLIKDNNLEKTFEEHYKDDLKEHFRDEAMERFR